MPLGYKGSYQQVRAYFRAKRLSTDPGTAPPPSPRTVAGWILRHPDTLAPRRNSSASRPSWSPAPELDALTGHVRSFAKIHTERHGQRLLERLDAVRNDNLLGLHTIAAGIDRARDAAIAGLTLPWNFGVVEGHVNQIKMLKRQMFGGAGFQPLRKRVRLYRWPTCQDGCPAGSYPSSIRRGATPRTKFSMA